MIFQNRQDAGRQLAEALLKYADESPLVLALPRGGVPVALEIARALDAPLDLTMVRKIGAPGQRELAIGAVADRGAPVVIWNEGLLSALHVPPETQEALLQEQLEEMGRRRARYAGARASISAAGRTAILVDDGLATGATMVAALLAVRAERPRRLVMAVPVGSRDGVDRAGAVADETVCLATPSPFLSVGFYYREFGQTSDDEVVAALSRTTHDRAPLEQAQGRARPGGQA